MEIGGSGVQNAAAVLSGWERPAVRWSRAVLRGRVVGLISEHDGGVVPPPPVAELAGGELGVHAVAHDHLRGLLAVLDDHRGRHADRRPTLGCRSVALGASVTMMLTAVLSRIDTTATISPMVPISSFMLACMTAGT
jgi:hypothetical protein